MKLGESHQQEASELSIRAGGDTAPHAGAPAAAPSAGKWAHAGARFVYWLPVFAAMTLFAQMSLFGLRPALCEQRRLADAEVTLAAREQRDLELCGVITAQLRARSDPIFRERQRRLRQAELIARQ